MPQGAYVPRSSPHSFPTCRDPGLSSNTSCIEFGTQAGDRPQFQIALEDEANSLCLVAVYDELPVLRVIAQGRISAHEDALLTRGTELVADALGRYLAFELGKAQENIERQPSHGTGGIEGLCHGDERGVSFIEPFDDLSEISEGSGKSVDLIDDHDIDPALVDIGKEPLNGWSFEGGSRETAIVIQGGEGNPTLAGLTQYIGLASLALGIQRVEGLFETLLSRFARIDCAPNLLLGYGATPSDDSPRLERAGRSSIPKNRGPDHRVPLMARATSERLP